MRQCAGIILRIRSNFGEGDVTRSFGESAEGGVRHRGAINPETVDGDAVSRRFFRIMFVRPHAEHAARHKDHLAIGRGGTATTIACLNIHHQIPGERGRPSDETA
ncbi:MAG: hypothetical protein QOI46_3298 [Alphaproteobacteria bacterium]|nr:hypothetical protein [Alphaproteobacteria bacterium]